MELLRRYLHRISYKAQQMNGQILLELLGQNKEAKILDIGCSDGRYSRRIAEKIGSSEIYGIDIVPKYADTARKNGVKITVGDIEKGLPYEDGYFDIIVSNQVIEHVDSTDKFVKECYRVLKGGGACIISTPNLASPHNILSLLLGYQPFSASISDELIYCNPLDPANEKLITPYRRHRRIFTSPALRALLEFHGFEIEALKGFGLHPLPMFLSRHFRWSRYSLFLTIKARKRND